MKVHRVADGRIAILRPKGDLHSDPEIDALVLTAKDLAASGNRALVIDLGDVEIVSSLGLGGFVRIYKAYAERDGKVVLCNLTRRVHAMIIMVKLSFLFDVYESEREAIHALEAWLAEHATA